MSNACCCSLEADRSDAMELNKSTATSCVSLVFKVCRSFKAEERRDFMPPWLPRSRKAKPETKDNRHCQLKMDLKEFFVLAFIVFIVVVVVVVVVVDFLSTFLPFILFFFVLQKVLVASSGKSVMPNPTLSKRLWCLQ